MSDEIPQEATPANIEANLLAPASQGADPLLTMIARAAADPQTDVDKFERLMAMYDRHLEREAQRAYNADLAIMQPELPEIEEKGEIHDRQGNIQSTYALWEDVQREIKPILAKYGFALTFGVEDRQGEVLVTGKLSHRAGHTERETKGLPLDTSGSKNVVQAHGSTVSYGQRYVAKLLLNLTSRGEDDDGQSGGTKLVSAGELETLRLLIAQGKFDEGRFCENLLKIPSLDQLPARRFRFAEQNLREALQKRAKQQQAKKPGELMDLDDQ